MAGDPKSGIGLVCVAGRECDRAGKDKIPCAQGVC